MQKVLITGGNKGIGLAITKLFLENNFEVFVLAREFTTFPTELTDKVKQITFDLQDIEKIPHLVSDIGDIDILINNAGMMHAISYDSYPEEKKQEILKLNIEAPVALITEVSKRMITKGKGRIVSISSIAGEVGHPDVWYGITKAGIINMTKSFAKLLGEKGIVINCVAPSTVEGTDMFHVIPDSRKQEQLQKVFTHRFAKPLEVAQTVYWLATESPEYINGVCIDINNGAFLR